MKQFYRVMNKDLADLQFCYGDEIELIERESVYSLVRLTDSQYHELIAAEVFVVRC